MRLKDWLEMCFSNRKPCWRWRWGMWHHGWHLTCWYHLQWLISLLCHHHQVIQTRSMITSDYINNTGDKITGKEAQDVSTHYQPPVPYLVHLQNTVQCCTGQVNTYLLWIVWLVHNRWSCAKLNFCMNNNPLLL